MNGLVDTLLARLAKGGEGVLVRVHATQGSAPREAGTWMAVWKDDLTGTIGGGQLEFQATQEARDWLCGDAAIEGVRRYPLGPSLGQCCGGVVFLSYRRIGAYDAKALQSELLDHLEPVALFGGGHVGAALARLLATLPFSVRWIDSRDGIFPDDLPAQIETEYSEPAQVARPDRKSTRLNSSHSQISYAVF